MTNGHLARAAATLACLALLPSAATGQPRLDVAAGKWTVDYGTLRCSLARRVGGPDSPILVLASYLGRDEPEFILMRDGSEPLPELPGRVRVVLSPSNHATYGKLERRRVQTGRIATLQDLGEGFIDRFAASDSMRLEEGGKPIMELALPEADRAVAALRACNDDLLRSWGIDVAAQAKLMRRARQVGGWISDKDYPAAAIADGQSGRVVLRFTVGKDGTASECRPVASSGVPVLDTTSCELITRRFRYEPALDADGNPTATAQIRTISWQLP